MHVIDALSRIFHFVPVFSAVDFTIPILWMEKRRLGAVTYLVEI